MKKRHPLSPDPSGHLIASDDRFEYVIAIARRAANAFTAGDTRKYAATIEEANANLSKMERGYVQGFIDREAQE